MNYTLNSSSQSEAGLGTLRRLLPLMARERKNLVIAFIAIFFNCMATLFAPIIVGYTVDHYIQTKNFHGVLLASGVLLVVYLIGLTASYLQTIRMGYVGRQVLFNLRNTIFNKLQELPVSFFNQNKAGDLISRINNDTDKLNQFFSQFLMQFVANFFVILGAAIFLLSLNIRLGAAALVPALGVLIVTQLISPWVKRRNFQSLQTLGGMSAEIQESLSNFRVIVAFNRLDYFRKKFNETNQQNYTAAVGAGLANNIFIPIYGLASSFAQLIVLAYGILLISEGSLTIGLLIGFLLYVNNFYAPLRQLASVWTSLQQALASLDRISEVLSLKSDMSIIPSESISFNSMVSFEHVSFAYPNSKEVLTDISFSFEAGKTYAFVGPTGGGKTTTASLMARLYDSTSGAVLLNGRDIRSYSPEDRAKKIGFILQEPFLFTGTLLENIFYGNLDVIGFSVDQLAQYLEDAGLGHLLERFEQGLKTRVQTSGESISLGQRQLIAFMRAVLRKPELLILDEATANIDTITERSLEEILLKLPVSTTKVIIAHRLNTIRDADQILFVNAGRVIVAGSMEHAIELLLDEKRQS